MSNSEYIPGGPNGNLTSGLEYAQLIRLHETADMIDAYVSGLHAVYGKRLTVSDEVKDKLVGMIALGKSHKEGDA